MTWVSAKRVQVPSTYNRVLSNSSPHMPWTANTTLYFYMPFLVSSVFDMAWKVFVPVKHTPCLFIKTLWSEQHIFDFLRHSWLQGQVILPQYHPVLYCGQWFGFYTLKPEVSCIQVEH